jgi:hypothetical protein
MSLRYVPATVFQSSRLKKSIIVFMVFVMIMMKTIIIMIMPNVSQNESISKLSACLQVQNNRVLCQGFVKKAGKVSRFCKDFCWIFCSGGMMWYVPYKTEHMRL